MLHSATTFLLPRVFLPRSPPILTIIGPCLDPLLLLHLHVCRTLPSQAVRTERSAEPSNKTSPVTPKTSGVLQRHRAFSLPRKNGFTFEQRDIYPKSLQPKPPNSKSKTNIATNAASFIQDNNVPELPHMPCSRSAISPQFSAHTYTKKTPPKFLGNLSFVQRVSRQESLVLPHHHPSQPETG